MRNTNYTCKIIFVVSRIFFIALIACAYVLTCRRVQGMEIYFNFRYGPHILMLTIQFPIHEFGIVKKNLHLIRIKKNFKGICSRSNNFWHSHALFISFHIRSFLFTFVYSNITFYQRLWKTRLWQLWNHMLDDEVNSNWLVVLFLFLK